MYYAWLFGPTLYQLSHLAPGCMHVQIPLPPGTGLPSESPGRSGIQGAQALIPTVSSLTPDLGLQGEHAEGAPKKLDHR